MRKEVVAFKAESLRSLWQDFCQKHTELYDLTCDEYMHLLASEIDELETTIEKKQALINFINGLDDLRDEIIGDLCLELGLEKDSRLRDLMDCMTSNGFEVQAGQIEKLNHLLLDIVEKIQLQNKKNQIFLNKALQSLSDLRASFSGTKNYKTYSPTGGITRTSSGY